MLALLPGGCHQQDRAYRDKSGILQRMRNLCAGMPAASDNHDE